MLEPGSPATELLGKCLEEAKEAGIIEGRVTRRTLFHKRLMDLTENLAAIPPDTSAVAPEHLIGFNAGWRTAMRRAIGELPALLADEPN